MSTVTDLETYQQFAEQQQAANNAWSAQQAQKQMDFQREMSNTAHQREVADLRAAGLNPILSANSGASVPNGASGETDTSAAGNVGAILQQVLQAQSAREVAAMYNAATINAASIAANASMYGADMSYANNRDHPNTLEAVAARQLVAAGKQYAPDAKTFASNVQKMVSQAKNASQFAVNGSFTAAGKIFQQMQKDPVTRVRMNAALAAKGGYAAFQKWFNSAFKRNMSNQSILIKLRNWFGL